MPEIIAIDKHTWRIEDGFVRFFLLEGSQKALMIDSGAQCPNAAQLARRLTSLPITLLNTHCDGDHTSGNQGFPFACMHPEEEPVYRRSNSGTIAPVLDGEILDLGDRPLEILHTPGHTPGSIMVLDRKNRVLFSGDTVQDSNIFMFGPHRSLDRYITSLQSLLPRLSKVDTIYPSHGTFPVQPELVSQLLEGAQLIQKGKAVGEPVEMFGNTVMLFRFSYAGFFRPVREDTL